MKNMHTLDSVSVGSETEVIAVHGQGTSLRRRLLDMGITPKTRLTLVRTAPLGDPLEIQVRGYSLTLRKADARFVEVA